VVVGFDDRDSHSRGACRPDTAASSSAMRADSES
jgi:hypothetical protein